MGPGLFRTRESRRLPAKGCGVSHPRFSRILLKLSGEGLAGENETAEACDEDR